jgi:lysophospholipase L1-like esterase
MATNVKIMYPGQIDGTVAEWNPAEYPLRYLAEGDSWFSFGSMKLESMLTQLHLSRSTALVSLAQPGDTIRRMSDISRNVHLDNWLSNRFGAYSWNALLISGGGNDVIDDAGRIIPASATAQSAGKPAGDYVDRARLGQTLADVQEGYRRIVALRDRADSPCPGVPLVTHAYDFATPRNAPARFLVPLLGPWLFPAMVAAKIPAERWNDVSDFILGALGTSIAALEAELPNFLVAPTQGTLTRALPGTTGDSNDWANEIHPNRKGFRELAKLLAVPLEALT